MADRRSPIPFGSPSLLDGVVQDIQGLHSLLILGHNGTFYIPFIPLSAARPSVSYSEPHPSPPTPAGMRIKSITTSQREKSDFSKSTI